MRLFTLVACVSLLTGCFAIRRNTPSMIVAAREGDGPAIRALVKRGCDPNAAYGPLNWTPLMHAISRNQIESVKALLDSGADVNKTGDYESEPRTKQLGVTPLMMAAGYGYTPIVQLLLHRGADTTPADGDGNRALDYALTGTLYRSVFECHDSTVRALLAAHAPRNVNPDSRKWAGIKRCETVALLR
ncbi:MAG TPA: ankyrin repeat domain-containing protein [Thermoanaerobaculia bacterium]|nr:ankyrin repeat domain-containing protein [Thermoanaerobaculia bacterium]